VLCLTVLACDDGTPADYVIHNPHVFVSGHDVSNMDCRSAICPHNENTDLIQWNGAFWLVHRSAVSQILGPNSSLWIYRSPDGNDFTRVAQVLAPVDRDIRDPHFFVVGNELRIKALTRLPVTSSRDSNVDTVAVVMRSTDGMTWSDPAPIGPPQWSFWRIKQQGGVYYTAAYHDGDTDVALFSSTDGLTWTQGADIYGYSPDTPLETELVFMPSGRMLALVRMDGTDAELLGAEGRLRTKVCWSQPPYDRFDCPQELMGQRLDGPVAFFIGARLFVIAREHLQPSERKRTALFELTGNFEGGPLTIGKRFDLPSAGDTAYAGMAPLSANQIVVSWYSSDLKQDEPWALGILDLADIWMAHIEFGP
jgi:hypothetical protein